MDSLTCLPSLRENDRPELDYTNLILESQSWFHSKIQRRVADLLVTKNGDFLVRESISMPGAYTLVVHWEGETINFLVSATSQSDGTSAYRLTSSSFQTVAELIQHHLRTGCPVSESSPAVLRSSIDRNRTAGASRDSRDITETPPASDPPLTRNNIGGDTQSMFLNSNGKNITSSLSPDSLLTDVIAYPSGLHESITNSARHLQLMHLVKSILFSSKVAYIPHRLLEYSPSLLASHITREDLLSMQLGSRKDCSRAVSDRLGASGFQRLLMPYNYSLQREIWFKHCQVKYLFLLSIFASSDLDMRSSLLAHLISLAKELSGPNFRNAFGFMSLMEALMSPHLSKLTKTWNSLRDKSSGVYIVFELQLKPLALSYFSSFKDTLSQSLIPYIQPVVHNLLLEVEEVQPEEISQLGSLMSGLNSFLNHFEAARKYSEGKGLCDLQSMLKRKPEDPSLKHFLQQNHIKTVLSKIEQRFLDDFEMYDSAEALISILTGLMSDY